MENGVDRPSGAPDLSRRASAKDAMGAIALAEGAIAEQVFLALRSDLVLPDRNAFGAAVLVERGASAADAVARFAKAAEQGKRAALVADAHDLAGMREALRALASQRVGTVVHAVAARGASDALALADLGWGMLFAAGVEEALDLTLVARRAAEDCGTPFFVVHESGEARHVEALAAPSREMVDVFVGAPASRVRPVTDPAHPSQAHVTERVFAERVPFALASALRELESLTGRRRDVLERAPAADAAFVLVGLGELGESLVADVPRLRALGHDVGAIKVTALRPFPGPRLIKAMARAVAVAVIEPVDEPLAQSGPLARETKAAFADAITWAPDYPGIGRIPRIAAGVARGGHIEAADLEAIVLNLLADERGKRSFVLGEDVAASAAEPSQAKTSAHSVSIRGRVRDARTAAICAEVVAAVVSSALGLHVRASVRRAVASEGEGAAFDLLAARERPRGMHAPHAVRLVVLEDAAMLGRANPIARLAHEGVLALPSQERSADAVWSDVPAYAKAIVFDRGASVVGWAPPDEADPNARPWLVAAAFAGLALACGAGRGARSPVDGSLVAREVAEALRVGLGPSGEGLITRGADVARRVFEARIEVPRATVERDEASVRLGRRDARASQPPR